VKEFLILQSFPGSVYYRVCSISFGVSASSYKICSIAESLLIGETNDKKEAGMLNDRLTTLAIKFIRQEG
jgi:hypothetical protein